MRRIATRTGSFDGLAEGYDFVASLDPDRHDFFLTHLSVGRERALDVGCGSGRLAAELAEHYEHVVGIDISEDMLALARKNQSLPNVEYLSMDASDIRLDGSFDLVCSVNTFHHVEHVPATLDRLKGLLSPGGRMVIADCVLLRFAWLEPFASRHPWVFIAGAFGEMPGLVRTHGFKTALRAFRFKASRPMRRHLASDRFLTPEAFRSVYGEALPGCTFYRPHSGGMAVIWDAPQ